MSLEPEEIARREMELMEKPNEVSVYVKVRRDGAVCIPDMNGTHEEKAVFKIMTFGDNNIIEKACSYEEEHEDPRRKQTVIDFNEMRRLMLKRNLLSWTLNVPIERENGWLTRECYQRVGRVNGTLIEAFLDGYWLKNGVTEEEEKIINRQATVLFGKNSRGVSDACEAVRLYCSSTSQWDKFGLKGRELTNLPYREYIMMKMMTSLEAEAMRRETKISNTPTTKIAGKGGKIRESRGQRIAL